MNRHNEDTKITFLVPPALDGQPVADRVAGCARSLYSVPNLFELTAAAAVEAAGFKVSYKNFPINQMEEKDFDEYLGHDRSICYAIYGVNLTKETDKIALGKIKHIKNTHVIFYGPGPTYSPSDYLLHDSTYVVRGEPEESLKALCLALHENCDLREIAGISYRTQGEVTENGFRPLIEDIDSLPFQAIHLIESEKHKYCNPKLGSKPVASVATSRNCPYQCTFCVPCSHSFAREIEYKRFHKKKPPVKIRSAENVIREIAMLVQNGYKAIAFQDDLFVMDKERIIEICRGIQEFSLRWGCATRADTIDDDVVIAMAAAGCRYIDLGVESFDERILKDIRKNIKVACIEPAIKTIKKHGIKVKLNILLGASALETVETVTYSMKKVKELDADQVMYNIANPFPGTELYETAKEKGWFTKGDYYASDVQKEGIMDLPELSAKQLVKLVRKGNRSFFLNPRFIFRNIRNFETIGDFVDALRALKKKLT